MPYSSRLVSPIGFQIIPVPMRHSPSLAASRIPMVRSSIDQLLEDLAYAADQTGIPMGLHRG
ncbi:MAG: hypothetical protein ABIU05_06930, partial [Nitrospirales bacterium]